MDLFDPTQLGLAAAMRATATRQTAIAQNLANANTPGYRRVTVDFQQQLDAVVASGDRQAIDRFAPQITQDAAAPVRADGSSVDVEREAADQAANGLSYEALAQVMRARIDIVESAIGAH
ncbi:MAG: flgB [Solirubrobacterales bacterium]|nr:flgB [Solirubrobacterales bacterium]